jgi:peptide/nickel transport system ATP-binding protein
MIARALSTSPEIMICDEPVSALDVAIQAQILNMFKRLQKEFGLTSVFISHDLAVIQQVCDQVGVMYAGQMIELASARTLFASPGHPYTWALMAAAAPPGALRSALRKRFSMEGEPPSPIDLPAGCRTAARCPFAGEICRQEAPPLAELGKQHLVACHRADFVAAAGASILIDAAA